MNVCVKFFQKGSRNSRSPNNMVDYIAQKIAKWRFTCSRLVWPCKWVIVAVLTKRHHRKCLNGRPCKFLVKVIWEYEITKKDGGLHKLNKMEGFACFGLVLPWKWAVLIVVTNDSIDKILMGVCVIFLQKLYRDFR